jgi:primosomal protein N' (replication factor Y)
LSPAKIVKVLLPLALPKELFYKVPSHMEDGLQFGVRVEVPLRSKLYSGLIVEIHDEVELEYQPKSIMAIIDEEPIITSSQYQLWQWIAKYYVSSLGEVMAVALPSGLKLSSETRLIINPDFTLDTIKLNQNEYIISEALFIQNELSIDDIKKLLEKKTVYPHIRSLLQKQVIFVKEELKAKYKPKKVAFVRWEEPFDSDPESIHLAMEMVEKSERQTKALLAYYQLSKKQKDVANKAIYDLSGTDSSVLKALEKKGILKGFKKEISRLENFTGEVSEPQELTEQQINAIEGIKHSFEKNKHVLLHGVTGSGKTRVYIELIKETIEINGQALYLLPEIALTTQIVQSLKAVFGDKVVVYHSKMNNQERVELWNAVLTDKKIVLGARSALFLPFHNLKLIIVDEEHDPSFKQTDPNPRYNARDVSNYMAEAMDLKVIMGTATPSLESYYNTIQGKYGLVEMPERIANTGLPKVHLINFKVEAKLNRMKSHYSNILLKAMKDTLDNGEQVLIFQNRRGFAPTLKCFSCGWYSNCINCDVSLTLHKYFEELRCHYCGYKERIPKACPACASGGLSLMGFGTEKIEEELKSFFPDKRIRRMDYDTVSSKHSHEKIISDFEEMKIDVLVGTQMITKGLDFDHIGLVGIINADNLLQFPDFRSTERAFQLMTQVSGRAGRREKQGNVLIQTSIPGHPIFNDIIKNDYKSFYEREREERQRFIYPPYYRLIQLKLKHKNAKVVREAAIIYADLLKDKLSNRVRGPSEPGVGRIRGFYIQTILIKLEKKSSAIKAASVRINVDVDPY